MLTEIATITPQQAERIIRLTEGHFADLKAIDIKPAKLSKHISAFANANGGELYIGIDEDDSSGEKIRSWRGFTDVEAANGHLQAFETLFPLGENYDYTFLRTSGLPGLVLQVAVRKSRGLVKASDGTIYLRRGAQSLPVDTEDGIKRLEFDKGIHSFESEVVNADATVITNSLPTLNFMVEVIPTAEPDAWLVKQQFIKNSKPTVGGVILFAEEPQALLPKRCAVKVYRYKTSATEGSRDTLAFDPITIEGHLYDQIKKAVEQTSKFVEGIQKLGPKGFEAVTYPLETLHEIVTNALLHRDYSIPVDVHIRIFDNRVEVESPGKLPGHITTDNILTDQFARNGTIVRMINKFPNPPNKDVGEGLNTAFSAMSKLRLKPPVIKERENSVIVDIRHEPLASPEESVMEYLEAHDEIVNRIGRQITGIASENSMKNVFYKLRDSGLIEPVPGRSGFGSAWRKKKSSPDSSLFTKRLFQNPTISR